MIKSSVSALQEYCAKTKIPAPTYTMLDQEPDGSFICLVEMDNGFRSQGSGRSKRDAKHFAAATLVEKLRCTSPMVESNEIPLTTTNDSDMNMPTTDMVRALRDYCVLHSHPLPTIEIIQQGGTADAPEFTAQCTLATIQRFGVSDKKKDARQKAAYEIFKVITNEYKMDSLGGSTIATFNDAKATATEECYLKLKTYRELTETQGKVVPGVMICDRHNHFKNFYSHIKNDAWAVLKSDEYESVKAQAMEVFAALKLTPKISTVPSVNAATPLIIIEADGDYDLLFVGFENQIYKHILEYFRNMLQ